MCSKKIRRIKEAGKRQSNSVMSQSHVSLIGAPEESGMGVQSYMTYGSLPALIRCRKFREEMTPDKLQRVESDTFIRTCDAS